MQNSDVLIIGAGPTGLTLAADLLRRGVSVRLIEKLSEPNDKSRALGIQAGTLEALKSCFGEGLCQELIRAGKPAREAIIHIGNNKPIQVDLSVIEGEFNFVLILGQSWTEKILSAELTRLGGQIERGTELLSLKQDGQGVACETVKTNQEPAKLGAKFVVGCDGAHSVVRNLLQVPFVGDQYEGNFILGDVTVKWPFSYGEVHTFISKNGAMACFPMGDSRQYRLILIPKFETAAANEISVKDFEVIAQRLSQEHLTISNATWLTRFRVHHRLAERFIEGRIFLAGDAAHIHSPVGGQGMNTGIQDALNLSEKIHRSIQGGSLAAFQEYEKERMAVAREVVKGTDRIFRLALLPENPGLALARRFLLPLALSNHVLQRKVVRAMSQVKVAREEIQKREILKTS